jgi:xylulose-5-phosphate/fructose-6-phosphate phosphoketolase
MIILNSPKGWTGPKIVDGLQVELALKGERRMGANPNANGGILLRDLRMPDFRVYSTAVPLPAVQGIGDTHTGALSARCGKTK